MLKTAALLLILAGSAGIGFSKSRELSGRLRLLEGILKFVVLLKGEIRCKSAALPEAFRAMRTKLPPEFGLFLEKAAEQMEQRTGQSFGAIFEDCARKYLTTDCLESQERVRFFAAGNCLGYLDGEMQLKQLDLYEQELKYSIEELRREMPAKKKMYQSIGVLGGALLAILVY